MGVMGTTNISINSAQQLWGSASGTQISMDSSLLRYLAGIPQSASGSQINLNKISGAGYFVASASGSSIDVRATCVSGSWNQSGPVWFIINGNSYSGSTGSAAIIISGSFPGGLILEINSGVTVSGKGGAGGTAGYGLNVSYGNVYGPGTAGSVGGPCISVSGYSGGSLYFKNSGTLAGGGGGGGGGRGGFYDAYYFSNSYAGGGGGGGSAFGGGGSGGYAGGSAQQGSAGTLSSGGAGGTRITTTTYTGTSANGGAGGGQGSSGTASYNAGGAAGACTTGTVAAGVTWIATGTRYGTIG